MDRLRNTALALSAMLCVIALQGCTPARMSSQWHDTGYRGTLQAGARVFVLCETGDQTLRRLCEDGWRGALHSEGLGAVLSYAQPGARTQGPANAELALQAARATGSAALVVMAVAPGHHTVIQPRPQVGIGIGGGSGGFSYGGIGISMPIGGGGTVRAGLVAETTLTDSARGAVVWSGAASGHANRSAAEQVEALVEVSIAAMKDAGILR